METHLRILGSETEPHHGEHDWKGRYRFVALPIALALLFASCAGDEMVAPDELPSPMHASVATSNVAQVPRTPRAQVPEDFPFKRILCFGDSLTLGVTQRSFFGNSMPVLTSVEGYPPKLGRLMEEAYGEGIILVNAGIGGENTREGLDRIDNEIRLHNPDIVLMVEGVVDINNEFPRFPVVRESLAEMMRLVQLRGRALVVGTVPRLNPDGFRIGGLIHVPRLNDVIRQEAKGKNAAIADHERAFPNDYSGIGPDGLHPNDKGYGIMAETWFEQIQLMLSELGFETAASTTR